MCIGYRAETMPRIPYCREQRRCLRFGVLKQIIRYKEGNEVEGVIGDDANAYGPAQESLVILGVWTMLMYLWFGQCSWFCVCICIQL